MTLSEADVWSVGSPALPTPPYWGQIVELGGGFRVVLDRSTPRWLYVVLGRIQHLMTLRPNWDSHGASPIHPSSAIYALEFLRAAMPNEGRAPQIVPTVHGGLQLEWHGQGVDLEVEVDSTARLSVSFEKEDRSEEQTGSALAPEGLESYVAEAAAWRSRG